MVLSANAVGLWVLREPGISQSTEASLNVADEI